MAVAFVSDSPVAAHSTANTVYTAPTGIADGNLLIIWQFLSTNFSAAPVPTTPTGFAAVPGTWPMTFTDPNSSGYAQYAWYRIAASESGNYTVAHAAATTAFGEMVNVSGNDTVTPFQPNPTQLSGVNAEKTTTFTGLTTTVANELILIFGTDDDDTTNTLTPPTGTTPTFTGQLVAPGGDFFAYGTLAAAGPTGDKTMTNNTSDGTGFLGFFSSMMAVQPPTGGGGDLNIYRIN